MWRVNGHGFVCPSPPTDIDRKLQSPFQSGPEAGVRNWFSLAYMTEFALNIGEKDEIRSNGGGYYCVNANGLVDEFGFCRSEEVAAEVESRYYWEEYPSIWGWPDDESA